MKSKHGFNQLELLIRNGHIINTSLGRFAFGWVLDHTWIYGRFEEPGKARQVYDCNQFTGKYNFHGFGYRVHLKDKPKPLAELMDFLLDLDKSNRLIKTK